MAASPTPDPSQQPSQPGAGDPTQQGAPDAGAAPSQAPAPPELMLLAKFSKAIDQLAQQVPAASAGLAKAKAGINEAMSAIVSQPQQQAPSQSPPY
ncbi:MAG TPA: hypothetical protein VK638_41450 [Edaphobacter sp.]|nr:hypothetical protein [Edaphobacter sp.]